MEVDPDRVPELEGMEEDPVEEDIRFNGIGEHLDELRRRLIVSLCVFAPCFGLGVWLYQDLWSFIIHPLQRAAPHLLHFQALNPSDGLVMTMRIAFAFACCLSLPVWSGQVWAFVAPGLTAREKKWLYISLGTGMVLFGAGVVLAYLVAIPYALDYLLPFNQTLDGWENAFTGDGYVSFVITCCAGFGIAFELPLVMMSLGLAGILTPEGIRAFWRPLLLGIFILAAVLTPPDPFTQMLLALPLVALFLFGYKLVQWTAPTD